MSCTSFILNGMGRQCKDSIGGVSKIWLVDYDEVTYTVEKDASTGLETGVVTVSSTDIAKFHPYLIRKNTSSMTSTLNYAENAGNSYSTEVVMQFLKPDLAKRQELMAIMMGEVKAIVKDVNGTYWALGVDNPIEATTGTMETGTAAADFAGANITLTDTSRMLPYVINDSTTISALESIVIA